MPLGSAISGLFGLLGTGIQYAQNIQMQDKQNKFNLEMWNKENEYNSPQAQMRRFEDAGLNSALMYGNVTPGNATSAPVKGVAQPPNWSKDMRDLAQAFNIVGLKEQIANMKKAQADARAAKAAADDAQSNNDAQRFLESHFEFDPKTGGFKPRPGYSYSWQSDPGSEGNLAYGKLMRFLADNYRTNSLLVPRAALIGSQTNLNTKRQELLAPQIRYWNFNTVPWRMNTRFWLGNARLGAQVITPFIP